MAPGLQQFEIILDSADNTYSPGEIISGRVIVNVNKTKSVRGLKLKIKGSAEVKWSESSGTGKDRTTIWCTANEHYFRMEIYLLGGAGDSGNVNIETGYHTYPFNFCLPRNIPSSFEHQYGNIRYLIKAVLDRPWKFDHETSMTFMIETPFDLTNYTPAQHPIDNEEHKTFCCFPCFNMGALKIRTYLPTSGFAVGEGILATVKINNTSANVDVTRVKLSLEQIVKFHCRTPHPKTKVQSNIVQRAKEKGPFPKNTEVAIGMQVPSLPSSNFVYCGIIDVSYRLIVKVSVSGCHCDTSSNYPIIIGTKPVTIEESEENSYGTFLTVQNPPPIPMIQPNVPSAPLMGEQPPLLPSNMPFPSSDAGQQFSGMPSKESSFPAPYPQNAVPNYGFASTGYQAYPPTMPYPPTGQGFQYPPSIPSTIGFVHPDSTQIPALHNTPGMLPPSYEDCMGKSEKK